jgi:hypothetical protein
MRTISVQAWNNRNEADKPSKLTLNSMVKFMSIVGLLPLQWRKCTDPISKEDTVIFEVTRFGKIRVLAVDVLINISNFLETYLVERISFERWAVSK